MANEEVEALHRQTQQRIAKLREVLAAAAIGDFSKEVPEPEEDDDFADLYVGIDLLLQNVRDKIARCENLNRQLGQQVQEQK